MNYTDPFKFWQLNPDGEKAYQAYEQIHSYFDGATMQYSRIYAVWAASSKINGDQADPNVFREKRGGFKPQVQIAQHDAAGNQMHPA
ncbi:MAG: hypothetical protein AB1722_00910 [Pseudomonadota bacterium]